MGNRLRHATVGALVGVLVVGLPETGRAHGIGGRADLPVPLELFMVGAGLALVASFVALALLWSKPRFQDGPDYPAATRIGSGRWLRAVLGTVGLVSLALVIAQVIPETFGLETEPTRPTIAPVMVWVVFWLVIPFAAAVVGDWYTDLSPWRAIGRVLPVEERPAVLDRLGVWPATAGFVAFTWLELVSPEPGEPVVLGFAALGYTFLMVAAMAYGGKDNGLQAFDAFTTYNRLISAISPLGRDESGRVVWRGWLRSLTVVPEWPGLWVLVVAMIGTVSYDGASGADWFRRITGSLGNDPLGRTFLLLGSVAVVAVGYLIASAIASRLGGGEWPVLQVARRFAHTLVPIALAYAVAHYFTLVLFEGQQLFSAISDPFALGWDLFGTAERRVEFFITSTDLVWYLQVASIVIGHVLGVVLAHDRALEDFGEDAVRSQYAMLVLMVGLTTLGLLILSG